MGSNLTPLGVSLFIFVRIWIVILMSVICGLYCDFKQQGLVDYQKG